MLYERLLDLAPGTRLDRRLAERVAARLAVGLLVAVPVCAIGAAVLVSGLVHALVVRSWGAGLLTGLRMRDGLDAALGLRRPDL